MHMLKLVLLGLLAMQGAPPDPPGYLVVVSPSNRTSSLTRRELAKLFLKKSAQWSDGSAVLPVDQSATSAVRAAFTRDVLKVEGMDKLSSVIAYWQQELYAGRAVPPPVKSGDTEVLAFVAANPGALGYVSPQAELRGVKVITVSDRPQGGR